MQRFDGIDPSFLWHLNSEADRPDLAVILEADPDAIDENGRGLLLVETLSARWDWYFLPQHNGGKVVWCELRA